MANFDPKTVTPVEWAGVGAGAAAFIFSFFPAFSYDAGLPGYYDVSVSWSAWSVGTMILAVLLMIGAAVVVLLPHLGVQVPYRSMIWAGAGALAALFVLVSLASGPGGPTIGWFLLLLAVIASAGSGVVTFLANQKGGAPAA
ncbi:hypothetical protein [Actinokineospora bangkokensis]|uniref:Uncharacterized protein n=1 Tax=Actinokineospora bangkokensis TaxID=1193682 RepID=A0A1Q9LHS8_9PSEU|nr:hypothetical protein [Actinokineospora bangkokensis]OLR91560.1 hypothetical protein BJP25_25685 [Actinokineospora bangkokensis]